MSKINYMKNITVNYLFTFISNVGSTQGIWMLYLASKGLSLFELGLLEGLFHVTSMLMETPTGAVADIFGRKTSRIVSVVLNIGASALMVVANSFWLFAVAFVVTALSYNFDSGANEALVYDSLLAEGKEKRYLKVAGRVELVFQATGVIAFIVGGALGNIQYEYAYYLAIVLAVASLFVALLFKEPPIKHAHQDKRLLPALKRQYVESFKAIRSNVRLLYLIVFSSIVCTSVTLTFYYMQTVWQQSGHSVLTIGIFLAAQAMAAAAGALVADRVDKRFGDDKILRIVPPIIAVSILALYFAPLTLAAFCVMNFFEALIFVATRDYINKTIPSDKRATILSFESLMFSVVMIALFPVFGLVSDHIGLEWAFVILGGLMLALSLVNLKAYKKTNGRKSK